MQNSIDDTIKWATLFAKLQDSQDLKKLIQQQLKANDDAWREKIEKAMGKDEQETFNHTYETLPCGISNIRVEAFTRNCFRKHIKKSLKENK